VLDAGVVVDETALVAFVVEGEGKKPSKPVG